MGLSYEDRLKLLLPARLYFWHKISKSVRGSEPELRLLPQLVRRGCVAVDIGANRGIYSHALSRIARQVEAFEPNPALAAFARRKLARNVRFHEVALADEERSGFLLLKIDSQGNSRHLTGVLRSKPGKRRRSIEVAVRTLDSFALRDVGFIKIDAEGSELAIVEGAKQTIRRERPVLLVELLTGEHPDPAEEIERIARNFDYAPWIVAGEARVPAAEMLRREPKAYRTNNVLFMPN